MVVAAFVISILAFLFALGSFWWLNARRGSVTAVVPQSYAFVEGFRLRLPLALFNNGAVPLLIADLRVDIADIGCFPWQTTRSKLRPGPDDDHCFAKPFSIHGRDTEELIAEFGENSDWLPEPGTMHRLRLEAKVHPSESWCELVAFPWWAPPTTAAMSRYIAHRNEAPMALS
jgi:hypothetical protein